MAVDPASTLNQDIDLFQCPNCSGALRLSDQALQCLLCRESFPVSDGIPMLFWPSDPTDAREDVTQIVKSFYEETPFPDYDDFDTTASLARKAREGIFARMLDRQIPPDARIIECGCGTGQLSNFLSIENRTVYATDMCMNSLRLGQRFARENELSQVRFVQMNLLRPAFKPASFHLVISNGVLMTTPDPFESFKTIAELVRPGGYILIGLYHKFGRLITDARRVFFRLSGDRLLWLDPNLRNKDLSDAKRRAWFEDQYKHPREVKHTIGEAMGWLKETGFRFVRSIPDTRPFHPLSSDDNLFEAQPPGSALERFLIEVGMIFKGSREGGFFTVIGRKG